MTRTLHVRLGPTERGELEESLDRLDEGEDVEHRPSVLSVESIETLGRIFRPTNLELLGAIREHEPESIRELARRVDRHPPEVHDNVTELEDYGLVELVDEGRARRPLVWYDELDVDVPLPRSTSDLDTASP